jgi:flagellar export protein FliJ
VKRYAFRLQQVLDVRRSEQDVARAGVLAATVRAGTEASALADRDRAYAERLNAPVPAGAAEFLYEQAHRAALGHAVLEQRRRLLDAEHEVEAARAVWTAAATRVGALERLDERQRAEHAARALREDELIVDDLVVSRHAGSDR